MLCSECNKNLAVIFMTKMTNGKQETEGLCFNCAKKRGIDPLNNMLLQSGISEEELESLTNEMEGFLDAMQQEGDSIVADDKSILGAFSKLFGAQDEGFDNKIIESMFDNKRLLRDLLG
jgi:ATP-dependent Clp protease ATP-binding subunit ClpE